MSSINHARVRSLDEPLEQCSVRFTWRCLSESGQDALDRRVRRHFSQIVPAYSIGHREQPAARARVLRSRRSHVPEAVLIPLANSTNVGKLRELDIHGVLKRTIASTGDAADARCSRRRLKAFIH